VPPETRTQSCELPGSAALQVLQEACEMMLVMLFGEALLFALHAGRVPVMRRDIQIATRHFKVDLDR
jgi:histone H3/H4